MKQIKVKPSQEQTRGQQIRQASEKANPTNKDLRDLLLLIYEEVKSIKDGR